MLSGRTNRQIIPQVDIFTNGAVNTADITDKLIIQKYPQVIITEEVIFQRTDLILGQRELHLLGHA